MTIDHRPDQRPDQRLPDFVVIGAQKSASSYLQDLLEQHPDIELARGETRTFEDPHYSPAAVAELPRLFTQQTARRGIKRPDYLGQRIVAPRLKQHLPDARLFVVLRDPISRAVSSYFHFVRHGFVPLMGIDAAMDAVLSGRLAHDYPRSVEILEYGNYGAHLQWYLEHFDREQLIVFEQRALIDDPATALRRAFAFLDVDDTFVPTVQRVSNKGVYSPRRLRILRTRNHRVFRYTPGLERRDPRRPSPLGWVYNNAVLGVDRLVLSRFDDGRPPAISAATRARLAEYYAPDRALLEEVLSGSDADRT